MRPRTQLAISVAGGTVAHQPAYVGHAVVHPASVFTIISGVGLGVWLGSALVTVMLLAFAAAVVWTLSACDGFRRDVDKRVLQRGRQAHRDRREERLEGAGVRRDQLAQLDELIDEIDRSDGGAASRRFELGELLDHYVEVAIARERCQRTMRSADRDHLVREVTEGRLREPGRISRRLRLIERRVQAWDRCKAQFDRCDDELTSIEEFVRLLAQRAGCAEIDTREGNVERWLWELDEEDAALDQLSRLDEREPRWLADGDGPALVTLPGDRVDR